MVFSSHYAKIGDVDVVTCTVVVVKDGGRRLLVFFESICKISSRFTNVFFIAPMFTAFISDLEEAMFDTGESLSPSKFKFGF